MVDIKDKNEKLIEYFKHNSNILAVWIVGSHGTELQREDSDIDFAILFENDIRILEEMKISNEISDIINYEDVDTIDLRKSPITLQFKAIQEGRSLYESDSIKVSDYIELVLNRYRDEKYYYDSFIKDYYDSYNV